MKVPATVPSSERYISPNEAGRILSVTGEAVKQWIYRRHLPAVKLSNGYWKIKVADLDEYVRGREGTCPRRVLLFGKPGTQLSELASVLEGNGCEVAVAQNASDALLKAQDRYPSLFVVNVASEDAWSLLKRIRRTRNIKTAPILILSDRPLSDSEGEQAIEIAAQGALVKPTSKEVVEEVASILSRVH